MKRITYTKGDGIGPEIMEATLRILKAAGADLVYDEIQVGEQVYLSGNTSGISNEAWETIRRNKLFLKAPITTPQGGGYKSLNVTARKSLGLFANIRPCMSLDPFISTKHPGTDVVIVRENEEDLYAGIEHQQTDEVVQCLKLITRPGCERIVHYAFEYAKVNGRKKVSCFTKDNIMKQTDGLFHRVFDEVAAQYPSIESEHWIVDIGAAKLADNPNQFDVIVLPNLYGDILSDIAAEITGSVGLGGSSNIGEECAMFEAIHGSAPDIAGQNSANPSGLINGAVMMLNHIGQQKVALTIQNALLKTIEEGLHTADIYDEKTSKQQLGTAEFADAVIERLGQSPSQLKGPDQVEDAVITIKPYVRPKRKHKQLVGVDVFVDDGKSTSDALADRLKEIQSEHLRLVMITNRGVKVWPEGMRETFRTDHWRCRFQTEDQTEVDKKEIVAVLQHAIDQQIDVIKTENLYRFDGKIGYSLGQGQ